MLKLIEQIFQRSCFALTLGWAVAAQAETVNVAVASNFVVAMQQIQEMFEAGSDHELRLIRGSSGKHYAQIVNGAPFDVFLSADQLRPQRLVEQGFAKQSSVTTYAEGQLALWSRQKGLDLQEKYLLNTNNYRRIAMANPRLAPYGQAAQDLLASLGLSAALEEKLVRGENIAQTFQFAFSGNADLALVAYSQTLRPGIQGQGSLWLVPPEFYQPIKQDMVILNESPAAIDFANFMASQEVRRLLIGNGYNLPEGQP